MQEDLICIFFIFKTGLVGFVGIGTHLVLLCPTWRHNSDKKWFLLEYGLPAGAGGDEQGNGGDNSA